MGDQNTQCWAACLGHCDRITGEHIISKALFTDMISSQGFSWCRELKTVGINSAVTNRLCKKHNNALSPLDAEGAKFWFELKRFIQGIRVNKRIEKNLLERWLLKCVVNMLATNDKFWVPSERLVNVIFGNASLSHDAGLGSIQVVGDDTQGHSDHFQIGNILVENSFQGACAKIRGFNFVVTYDMPVERLRHPDYPATRPMRVERINNPSGSRIVFV